MRALSAVCALVLTFGSSSGCGAKSDVAHMTSDPLGLGSAGTEDSGALPNRNGPDATPPKKPPRKPPSLHDAGHFPPLGTGGAPPTTGAGGAPPTTGHPDAEVPPPSDAGIIPTLPIAIGVIKSGEFRTETCVARFVDSLGADARVETIDAASDYATFRAHDLIVACSNWAELSRQDVLGRPELYTQYVREGGGLLMFQPNPYPLESMRIDLLPEWFVVANFYTDDTVSLIEPNHPVTQGLTNADMPYPADRITAFSDAWTELSRGDQSGDASLIVVDIGRGRAAVDGAHHEFGVGKGASNNSNALIRRLSLWLTHRL
jgi:hypothetical protein